MSGTDDESLSLESLFAFVDGLSPHAEDDGAARNEAEPSAPEVTGAPEEPSAEKGSGDAGAAPDASSVVGEGSGGPDSPHAVPPAAGEAGGGECAAPAAAGAGEGPAGPDGLALLSMVVQLPSGIGAPLAEPAPCRDGIRGLEEGLGPARDAGAPAEDSTSEAHGSDASGNQQEEAAEDARPQAPGTGGRAAAGVPSAVETSGLEQRRGHEPEARPRRAVRGKHAADPGALLGETAPRAGEAEPPGRPLPSQPAAPAASDAPTCSEGANPLEGPRRRSHGAKEPFPMDEARAAIEERLVKIVFERTRQIGIPEAEASDGHEEDALRAASPEPPAAGPAKEPEIAAAKGGVPEMTQTGGAENGNTPVALSGNEFEVLAPDPEIEAIGAGPSIMFDEPPSSIGESMRLAESEHRRGFAFKVAVGGAIGAAAVAVVALLAFNLSFLTEAPEGADDGTPAVQQRQTTSDEALDVSEARGGQGSRQPERDLSGTVVYRYTASGSDGEERPTVETVSFGRDGLCETSTIEVELSDAEAAQAFVEGLERDFGSAYREGSAEGATARATVDVSANRLDREAYEDELRVSVEDLAIVKKS